MNKEYAGLGDVVYVTLNNGDTIKIGMSAPSSQDKSIDLTISETEKKRHDKLKEELLYTPPEGIIVPMGDGTYQSTTFTEEEREQLAKELWPSKYKKVETSNNKEETK